MEENPEIEDLNSKLTNLAMLYKEYKKRHDPTMDIEDDIRIHKLIFSKTADTILNKDPDLQSEFRENYFKKLSESPSPPMTQLYADILFSEYLSITEGVSLTKLRIKLCNFFESRISYYHQYKFKLLLQWAYTVEFFDYKSIDLELENLQNLLEDSIERYQRLQIDDEIEKNNKRPIPKTVDGTDLYIHSENLLNSNIARDDIEVYITTLTEKNNESRVFENFLISAKWMHIIQKCEIWEKMVENLMKIKEKSMKRLKIILGADFSYALFFLKSLKKN